MYKEFKNVIEFRDKTWWCPAVINRLKKKNLIFCGIKKVKEIYVYFNNTATAAALRNAIG